MTPTYPKSLLKILCISLITWWMLLAKKLESPIYGWQLNFCVYLQKDACVSMFIAALFRRVKMWIQAKCPLREEWIKKMWYIYTMEYYSDIKKNEIMPFAATWMDLEIVTLSEISQRRRTIIWHPLYVESKKKWYK